MFPASKNTLWKRCGRRMIRNKEEYVKIRQSTKCVLCRPFVVKIRNEAIVWEIGYGVSFTKRHAE